jgi:hypothetical protein
MFMGQGSSAAFIAESDVGVSPALARVFLDVRVQPVDLTLGLRSENDAQLRAIAGA